MRGSTAWVYKYRVSPQANHLWYLEDGNWKSYPGFGGKLWIDPKSLRLVRMEKGDIKVDARFPIQRYQSTTDYENVGLGDGTRFNLPVAVNIYLCDSREHCWKQDLMFRDWHKFGATSRVLEADPAPAPMSEPVPDPKPK